MVDFMLFITEAGRSVKVLLWIITTNTTKVLQQLLMFKLCPQTVDNTDYGLKTKRDIDRI